MKEIWSQVYRLPVWYLFQAPPYVGYASCYGDKIKVYLTQYSYCDKIMVY